jgi:GTPase SAR1 family protein
MDAFNHRQKPSLKISKTVVMVGAREVGKTTILQRYIKKKFEDTYKETIGNIINNYVICINRC